MKAAPSWHLIANERYKEAIRFIVAYQTISDYLDNLCDRSTSLDPEDFAALHEAMIDAFTVDERQRRIITASEKNMRMEIIYMILAATCREVLYGNGQHYDEIKEYLLELMSYYCDLQIHKHVIPERTSSAS